MRSWSLLSGSDWTRQGKLVSREGEDTIVETPYGPVLSTAIEN